MTTAAKRTPFTLRRRSNRIRRCGYKRCCADLTWFFFFQAEDGIRDVAVTGVQTCALPIYAGQPTAVRMERLAFQLHVPVDPVELEEREERGMGPAHPPHRRRELHAQPARDGPAVPFVEVAHQHARPLEGGRPADEAREGRELVPPFPT